MTDTSPANAAGIVNFVGYGPAATAYEGSAPTPTAAADKSLERKAQASFTVVSMAAAGSDVVRGNSTGGGYQLATGTVLTVNNNTLSFATNSKAAIASGTSSTGALALSPGSSLSFGQNNNANLGTLLLTPTSTHLTNLAVNATGGTINNNTFTLNSSLTVAGTLSLTAGTLAIGAGNVLTLNGPVVTASGLLRGAPDADLLIGGAGAMGVVQLPGGSGGQLRNFTLNRSGQMLSLGNNLVVNAAMTLTAGVLDITSNTLTLNSTVATTATGLLNGSGTSNLSIGSTGALGTISFTPTGGLLNALTLNRPGGTLAIVGAPLQVDKPTLISGILSLGAGVAFTVPAQRHYLTLRWRNMRLRPPRFSTLQARGRLARWLLCPARTSCRGSRWRASPGP